MLVSLLRGVGYDAYVVNGYAVKKITTKDETKIDIDDNKKKELINEYSDENDGIQTTKEGISKDGHEPQNKYKIKGNKMLESKFLKRSNKQEISTNDETLLTDDFKEGKSNQELDILDPYDEFQGLRIHFWVLILPGKR